MMLNKTRRVFAAAVALASIFFAVGARAAAPLLPRSGVDLLICGSGESEQAHKLSAAQSQIVRGAFDEPARRLLPGGGAAWEGGKLSFSMKVDPEKQNYFTARFWGDEMDKNLLILFCEGKQVGYRHLGDIDILALPDDEPRYNGRFYYITTPLPAAMTRGKRQVHLEIRATGPIWGYGNHFDQYQKPIITPTRGIYRLYTHTDGCFTPPPDEKQGEAPKAIRRAAPGPEVLQDVKKRVDAVFAQMLKSPRPLNQMELQFLARGYFTNWTVAHENKTAVEQTIKGVDALYLRFKKNPDELWKDKATWNPGWFGLGPAGDAVRLLARRLEPSLDQKIDGDTTRREAWSQMFQASCDWLRTHRRWLANQAMFTDANLYLCNRAVAAIDPAHALAEEKARDYLYQAAGLVPWLGSDADPGPEKPLGDHFHQVTDKGLTRELGYVGGYGEVGTAGVMEMYAATREPGGAGDPRLKAQLAKMIRARGPFRYPMPDRDNFTAMRLETAIGWRDPHFPGPVVYVQASGGDESPLREAAATLDPFAIGYAQQMFADNQFFALVADHLKDRGLRSTVGLLGLPGDYELVQAQSPNSHRLPMSWDQPDSVFSDEEEGVAAIKHGREILYVSLYWRAGFAVNFLARTHYLTPNYQQVAVVREDVRFDPSGETFKRPDWINFGFGKGGTHIKYPKDLHQAYAGEELPIAKMPPGVAFKPGDFSHFAGRGEFYVLRHGPYLIAMNTTSDKTFSLKIPAEDMPAKDLISGRADFAAGSTENVGPRSTIVLYFGE